MTGPNGSGKSTFLAALAGLVPLDRGTRSVVDGARLGVVAQEGPALPRRRRTAPGSTSTRARRSTCSTPVAWTRTISCPSRSSACSRRRTWNAAARELSAGQRRRFDLARALLAAPHVLVLDEPTNHLSIDLVDELTEALRVTPAAVVVATHDRRMREDLDDWPRLELG